MQLSIGRGGLVAVRAVVKRRGGLQAPAKMWVVAIVLCGTVRIYVVTALSSDVLRTYHFV